MIGSDRAVLRFLFGWYWENGVKSKSRNIQGKPGEGEKEQESKQTDIAGEDDVCMEMKKKEPGGRVGRGRFSVNWWHPKERIKNWEGDWTSDWFCSVQVLWMTFLTL